MKVDLGIWDKLTWAVIVLGLIAGLVLVGDMYLPLISQNKRMRLSINKLTDQINREEETNKWLKGYIESLRHDPKTVERAVREKLGYAKPDEFVIRITEPAASNSTAAAH
jgi:cell division protein FtsB